MTIIVKINQVIPRWTITCKIMAITCFIACDCVCVCRERLFPHFRFWSKESIVLSQSNLREGAQLESEGERVRGNRAGPLLLPQNAEIRVEKYRFTMDKYRNTEATGPDHYFYLKMLKHLIFMYRNRG